MNVKNLKMQQLKLLRRLWFSLIMFLSISNFINAQVTLSADCMTGTADLSGITPANQPPGATLTWHIGFPVSNANIISNVMALSPGTYYAAFYDPINDCYSTTATAVNVSVPFCLDNICPATTVDLTTAISTVNLPANTILTYHTALPATDSNKISNPSSVGTGNYFAAFFDPVNGCYSGDGLATTEIIVTVSNCEDPQFTLVADCTTGTADLSGITPANQPVGAVLTWHDGIPVSNANIISNVMALSPGTYYAAFYDPIDDCYSTAVTEVTVLEPLCLENICPATTVDLIAEFTVDNQPANTTLEWHTVASPIDNTTLVSDPTSVGDGTYYAVFYDAVNMCYSDNSTAVLVEITTCCTAGVKADNISEGTNQQCLSVGETIQRNIISDNSEILPAGYQLLYILTDLAGNIVTSNSMLSFDISATGSYLAYSVAYNMAEYDVATASTLAEIAANIPCVDISASILIEVEECCAAFAGQLMDEQVSGCAGGGEAATLTWNSTGSSLPLGFVMEYILADGVDKTIFAIGSSPSFIVTTPAYYTVHQIVYNPAELDLSSYAIGVDKLYKVNGDTFVNNICADIDLIGGPFVVEDCCSQDLYIPGVGISVPANQYERDGIITSDGLIDNSPTDFDSGTEIEMLPGFEVVLGVEFHAYIDGCN